MKKQRKYPVLQELKGKIREEGKTYKTLSLETGMSVDCINNKVNGYSAIDTDDVALFVGSLHIEPNDILRYFFPHLLRNAMNVKKEAGSSGKSIRNLDNHNYIP